MNYLYYSPELDELCVDPNKVDFIEHYLFPSFDDTYIFFYIGRVT